MEQKQGVSRENSLNYWEVLYAAANNSGVNTTDIGPKLGLSRAYVASGKATKTDTGVSNAARLLGVCGYALCAVPENNIPDDALVISTI